MATEELVNQIMAAVMKKMDGPAAAPKQAGARPALQKFLRAWVPLLRALPQASKVRWSVDVDPLDF